MDHDVLEASLGRCGAGWNAAQAHGLLCGLLAVLGTDGAVRWMERVLAQADPNNALRAECGRQLEQLFQETWQQLAERQSEFDLLLPGDDAIAADRAAAIGGWAEGFLHGLVSEQTSPEIKKRLAEDPLETLIRDLLEISRAEVGEDDDAETNEQAYAEIVEYARVAAQLTFEELAEHRTAPNAVAAAVSDALH